MQPYFRNKVANHTRIFGLFLKNGLFMFGLCSSFSRPTDCTSSIYNNALLCCLLQACYIRGLNSVHLSPSECRLWLNQWLALSCSLKGKSGRPQASVRLALAFYRTGVVVRKPTPFCWYSLAAAAPIVCLSPSSAPALFLGIISRMAK